MVQGYKLVKRSELKDIEELEHEIVKLIFEREENRYFTDLGKAVAMQQSEADSFKQGETA